MDVLDFFKSLTKDEIKTYSKIKKGLSVYGVEDCKAFEGAVNATVLGNKDPEVDPETGVSIQVKEYLDKKNKPQDLKGKAL